MNYVITEEIRQAFIVRMPGEIMKEKEWALLTNVLNMGWEKSPGLTDDDLTYEEFREIIYNTYFPEDEDYRRAGRMAGNAWRFIKEMTVGNYILLPIDDGFYIAKIDSDVHFDDNYIQEKSGYKRTIQFLNNQEPIKIDSVPQKLQQKLRTSQAITDVTDLIQEVEFSLRAS